MLGLKLRREAALTRRLNIWANKLFDYVAQSIEYGSLGTNSEAFERLMVSILIDHYARTIAEVTGQDLTPEDTLADLVPDRVQHWRDYADYQARMIMDTIVRDLDKLSSEDLESPDTIFASEHRPWSDISDTIFSPKDLSRDLVRDLVKKNRLRRLILSMTKVIDTAKRWFSRRAKTIANVNTNPIVEQTRADMVLATYGAGGVYKTWMTKEDERVRPAHVVMHGVTEPIGEDFIVDGYRMSEPGDATRGAPLRLIINCRCWCRYHAGPTVPSDDDQSEEIVTIPPVQLIPSRPRQSAQTTPSGAYDLPTDIRISVARRTSGKFVLADGRVATYTAGPGGVVIRVDGKPVASASLIRDPSGTLQIGQIVIAVGFALLGLEQAIRDSVEQANENLEQNQ